MIETGVPSWHLQASLGESERVSTLVAFVLGVLLGLCAIGPVLIARHRAAAVTVDAKTGLLTAAAFSQRTAHELSRAARDQTTIAVLMIDVDNFKRVNDRYGHLVGDAVLGDIARNLAAALRAYDVLARFGGDEFVALLPNTTPPDALAVARRLGTSGLTDRLEDEITISIGIATSPGSSSTTTQLLEAADQALYTAQRAGRNQVRIAAGQPRRGGEPR